MERTFMLEYSQKQKAWHHNHGQSVPNTNGYATVCENCTNDLSWKFTNFVQLRNGKKYREKLTIDDMRNEWELFTQTLPKAS